MGRQMPSGPGTTFRVLPDWPETRGQGDETACVAPTVAAVTLAFSPFSPVSRVGAGAEE